VVEIFGPVKRPAARAKDGSSYVYAPDLQIIDAGALASSGSADEASTRSLGGLDPRRPGLFETFHIDDSYVEEPACATALHARELPRQGGNTEFLHLGIAYARLSEAERDRLTALRGVHAHNNQGAFPRRVSARGPADVLVHASHPLIRAHPVTGRLGLYFDLDRATHVEGLPLEEGRALLEHLQEHAEQHGLRYRHAWQPHDILLWDNGSLQHRACGDFPIGEPRRFWRHMIATG